MNMHPLDLLNKKVTVDLVVASDMYKVRKGK